MEVGGFNADFDGDQMAIFHPISSQAQAEVKEKMTRASGNKSSRSTTFEISKEMCVGLYIITKDVKLSKSPIGVSQRDLEKATDPYIPVRFRNLNTTMGKAIFNNALPNDFRFINEPVNKKLVNGLIFELMNKYGDDVAKEAMSKIEKIGFKFATIMAPSLSLDDIEIPDEILRMKKQLDGASTEEAVKILKEMENILVKHLKGTGLYDLVESGAAKGWSQPMQILVSKGIIADPSGNVLPPIKSSFSEGLSNKEFFEASAGSRKGIMDRVINTSTTGYMARKLVYVLNSVEADPYLKDCKTKRTVPLKLTKELMTRLDGRFIIEKGSVVEFKPENHKIGDVIQLRSPIYCESPKICFTCYGKLLQKHRSPYVGIIAGTNLGEGATQGIMRTFHTGGAVEGIQKNVLKDILINDPLAELEE